MQIIFHEKAMNNMGKKLEQNALCTHSTCGVAALPTSSCAWPNPVAPHLKKQIKTSSFKAWGRANVLMMKKL